MATNRNRHVNEASKQTFANNVTKNQVNTRKVSFPIGTFVSMYIILTNLGRSFVQFEQNQ